MTSTPSPDNHHVQGHFGLPSTSRATPASAASAAALAATLAIVTGQLVTQWLAAELHHQAALGAPFFSPVGPLYPLWRLPGWLSDLARFDSTRPLVLGAILRLAGAALASIAIGRLYYRRRSLREANRANDLHGSARFADRNDIRKAGLFSDGGVVLAQWLDRTALRWLRSDSADHVLFMGPTGSGKGVGPILSTLLTWRESAVILDPKGENHKLTSGWRSTFSDVFVLDLSGPSHSTASWNPLAEVRLRTTFEVADAQRIALQMVAGSSDSPKGEASQYFIDTATTLLAAAILHTLYSRPAGCGVPSLADVDAQVTDPVRGEEEVFEDWLEASHDPTLSQGWADEDGYATATHPFVMRAAREHLNRVPRDRSPIQSTVVSKLALFRDPLLARSTGQSDFELLELVGAERPVTVYLRLRPNDLDRLRPVTRTFIDLIIRKLTEDVVAGAESTRRKLLLLLDEFPILGKMSSIESALAFVRGWGLRFFLAVQDYEQVVATYGRDETVSSNTPLVLAYAPNKMETAKLLSSLTGYTTALARVRSTSRKPWGGFGSTSYSDSEQLVKRALLDPDECRKLPGPKREGKRIVEAGDMLVFAPGTPVIYAKQPLYFQSELLAARAALSPAPPRPARLGDRPEPPAPKARPVQEAPRAPTPPDVDAMADSLAFASVPLTEEEDDHDHEYI